MKTLCKQFGLLASALLVLVCAGCNKNLSAATASGTTTTTATSATIAVAASSTTSSSSAGSADSVLILQPCGDGNYRDSIDSTSLPTAITTYLDSNYAGHAFAKAFVIKDSAGTIKGYAVVIYYNGKPVGLLFDALGSFLKVLEQRQPGDLDGKGWHEGGRFCDRDGKHRDTIALANLPSAITTYIATNYPADTLLKAFITADSGYVVISTDNGLYATVFTASGAFVKRELLPAGHDKPQSIVQTALPAAVLSYLSTTYPNYVFNKAFALVKNNITKGYVVVIDANNTKYAVVFDASGNFVTAKTIY